MTSPHLKAVIFDIGGVVLRSPFIAIAEYEKEHHIPHNYLNCSIVARGSQGAWQKFERGELSLFPFYEAFSRDLSDTKNGNVWYAEYCKRKGVECPDLPQELHVDGRELFGRMMQQSVTHDEHIVEAISRIRAARKWLVIALTNNFSKLDNELPPTATGRQPLDAPNMVPKGSFIPQSELEFLGWTEGAAPPRLRALFDDFVDSSTTGMRKPEPEFYLYACKKNGIRPQEAVFLDDIGLNLKAANQLGMETILVPIDGSLGALKILEGKLGIDLTGPATDASPAKL